MVMYSIGAHTKISLAKGCSEAPQFDGAARIAYD